MADILFISTGLILRVRVDILSASNIKLVGHKWVVSNCFIQVLAMSLVPISIDVYLLGFILATKESIWRGKIVTCSDSSGVHPFKKICDPGSIASFHHVWILAKTDFHLIPLVNGVYVAQVSIYVCL